LRGDSTDLVYWAAAQARPTETSTADIRKEIEDLFAGWPEPVAHHSGHACACHPADCGA
jgi:hypothetical protein